MQRQVSNEYFSRGAKTYEKCPTQHSGKEVIQKENDWIMKKHPEESKSVLWRLCKASWLLQVIMN